jgi:hypothetical protein
MSDDPQNRKKKPPRIWHLQHEKILKEWGEASSCYRLMHFRAYQINKNWSMGFTLPVIIISTITGTANFAQKTFPNSWVAYVPSVIGAFNLFAAIMTTVAQFLKVTELMEGHRVTSIQYGKLARKIRLELTLPSSERTQHGDNMVEICRAEYDRLIEQSPPVPKDIILYFDNKFPITSNISRPELSTIRPIDLFDSEKDEERIKLKHEKLKKETNERLKGVIARYQPGKQEVISELSNLGRQNLVTNRVPSHPANLSGEIEVIVEPSI